MIRLITYISIHTFSLIISSAQIKSEEILMKNDNIEHPRKLTYSNEKSYLSSNFPLSQKLISTIVTFVKQ